ncbi:MAG TPA: DUF998 domain-containing protein [Candidatus Nanopelagicales bacterium]|nr:DUF998 domain-containing protein [Candidatus Nanopelagicales bacterium]
MPAPAVPWWARASSLLAPVLLIGGWTVAAALQQGGFDPVQGTISALAALDASDRWVMTVAIAGTGVCHVITALGLRPAAPAGRVLLALGGAATLLVAALPLPSQDGGSVPHGISAFVAFALLSAWPLVAWRRGTTRPWGLRPTVSIAAGLVLVGLLVLLGVALRAGSAVGLTERVAAGAQALWPAIVIASVPRRHVPGS